MERPPRPRRWTRSAGLGLALALALAAGCARDPTRTASTAATAPAPPKPPAKDAEVILEPAGDEAVRVKVELARTHEEQQRGLMYRDRVEPGHGMLFLFPVEHHLEFWMHNTYVPLDMIFIKSDRRVLGVVENAVPLDNTSRGVPGDSQFVLEVPAGFAARYRIKPGTPVRFVGTDRQE